MMRFALILFIDEEFFEHGDAVAARHDSYRSRKFSVICRYPEIAARAYICLCNIQKIGLIVDRDRRACAVILKNGERGLSHRSYIFLQICLSISFHSLQKSTRDNSRAPLFILRFSACPLAQVLIHTREHELRIILVHAGIEITVAGREPKEEVAVISAVRC